MACIVCNLSEGKYKCKTCLYKTCSLDCYKAHNDVCVEVKCEEITSTKSTEPTVQDEREENITEVISEEPVMEALKESSKPKDSLPYHVKQKLLNSKELHEMLKNEQLRNALTQVHTGTTSYDSLQLTYPEFITLITSL